MFSSIMYAVLPFLTLMRVTCVVPRTRLSLLSRTLDNDNAGQSVWWARVGDSVFRAPQSGANIKEYYYAYGSHSALPQELRSHRVAGEGRLHVFHLPGGPNSTISNGLAKSLPQAGGRRAAISLLKQLKHGIELSSTFPEYTMDPHYMSPLNDAGVSVEQTTADKITPEIVMDYLKKLTSLPNADVPSRSWSDVKATNASVDYLFETFSSMGFKTSIQNFQYRNTLQRNVIAMIPGSANAGSSVTVGAHYDSRPFDGSAPGAIDNGSGTAGLLALAWAFKEAKIQPLKSVYFVAFAGEEMGLLGSEEFAAHLTDGELPEDCRLATKEGDKHSAIIMDEIAWKSPALDKRTVNLEAYDWATDVLEHLGQASKTLNGNKLTVVHSGNPFGSDHMSFLNRDMQAVLTIHGDDEGYPDYHAHSDKISNADPELLTNIVKMNMGGLLRMSGVEGMMK